MVKGAGGRAASAVNNSINVSIYVIRFHIDIVKNHLPG